MSAGSIVIDLLMRTGAFETDTKRAEKALQDFKKKAVDVTKNVALQFTAVGTAVAYFAKQTIDGIDALNDVADATGASIENISALENVALRTGGTLENVSSILVKFNNVLKEGDPDKGPGAVIKALGLSIEELKQLDPAEALRRTAVALAQFADDGAKARAVQELFGKSVAEVAPLLKDLSEQTKLVGTVTKEQAEEAEKFNKAIFNLKTDIIDLSRGMLGDLLPAINEIIDAFKRGQKEGQGFFEKGWAGYKNYVREFWGIEQQKGRMATGKVQEFAGGGRGFVNPEVVRPSINVVEVGKTKTPKKGPEVKASDEAIAYARALDVLNTSQIRAMMSGQELTGTQSMLVDFFSSPEFLKMPDTWKQAVAAQAEATLQAEKFANQQKILNSLFEDSGIEMQREQMQALADAYEQGSISLEKYNEGVQKVLGYEKRLNELLTDSALEQQRQDMQLLASAFESGKITADQFTEAAQRMLGTDTVSSLKEIDSFAKQAAENIQDYLGDGLYNLMQGNFDNIAGGFKQMLDRMVAEALAAQLARAMFGGLVGGGSGEGWFGGALKSIGGALGFGGGASGGGGWFGKAFESVGGILNFGGAKAGGGDVIASRPYLIGENGPEMFVPRTAGSILPNQDTAPAQRQGSTIVVNMQANPQMSRDAALQQGQRIAQGLQLAMLRNG